MVIENLQQRLQELLKDDDDLDVEGSPSVGSRPRYVHAWPGAGCMGRVQAARKHVPMPSPFLTLSSLATCRPGAITPLGVRVDRGQGLLSSASANATLTEMDSTLSSLKQWWVCTSPCPLNSPVLLFARLGTSRYRGCLLK